jgi:hypothetical protein
VPLTLSEFQAETELLGRNLVVNQPGWEQVLEANKQDFFLRIASSARFVAEFPTSMSPTTFVDQLFGNAGITPTTAERAAAINEFGSASNISDIGARARVLRLVADNAALKQAELNRAFVLMQYFGYLGRNPNDFPEPNLDFQGYTFWLNKLEQFNGNFVDAEMVKAFLDSSEYRQRFGP